VDRTFRRYPDPRTVGPNARRKSPFDTFFIHSKVGHGPDPKGTRYTNMRVKQHKRKGTATVKKGKYSMSVRGKKIW
jgi:hypothetical protein